MVGGVVLPPSQRSKQEERVVQPMTNSPSDLQRLGGHAITIRAPPELRRDYRRGLHSHTMLLHTSCVRLCLCAMTRCMIRAMNCVEHQVAGVQCPLEGERELCPRDSVTNLRASTYLGRAS